MDSFGVAGCHQKTLLPGGKGHYQASFDPQSLAGMGYVVISSTGIAEMRTGEVGLFPSDGVQGLAAGGGEPGYP
jgi:hypothetical protein